MRRVLGHLMFWPFLAAVYVLAWPLAVFNIFPSLQQGIVNIGDRLGDMAAGLPPRPLGE